MRYFVFIILFTICVLLKAEYIDFRDTIGYNHTYCGLTYDGAEAGDLVGRVAAMCTYDTIGTLWFEESTANPYYSVDSATGLIYIQSTPPYDWDGDTLWVTIHDDDYSETYWNRIIVKDEDSCVFIDPDYSGTESGTREFPYNRWNDFSKYARFTYLQKCGTEVNPANALFIGAGEPWITIASYDSASTWPEVYDDAGDDLIWLNDTNQFVYNFNMEAGNGFGTYTAAHNIFCINCYVYGEFRDNGGFYIFGNGQTKVDNKVYLYNCSVDGFDNTGSGYHNYKLSATTAHNCYSYESPSNGRGFSLQGDDNWLNYCYSYHGSTGAFEIQADSTLVENCVAINSYYGIVVEDNSSYTWSEDQVVRNNYIFDCGNFAGFRGAIRLGQESEDSIGNIIVENNYIEQSKQDGFQIYGGSLGVIFRYNIIDSCAGSGINFLSSNTNALNTYIHHNLIKRVLDTAIYVDSGDSVLILNNTCTGGDSIVDGGITKSYAINNIAGEINADTETTNFITTQDTLYVNTDRCIPRQDSGVQDGGTSVSGYTQDYRYFIYQNEAPRGWADIREKTKQNNAY